MGAVLMNHPQMLAELQYLRKRVATGEAQIFSLQEEVRELRGEVNITSMLNSDSQENRELAQEAHRQSFADFLEATKNEEDSKLVTLRLKLEGGSRMELLISVEEARDALESVTWGP